MENGILRVLKICCESLRDTSGNWLDVPIGKLSSYNTNYNNIEKIKDILNIVLISDEISLETKLYIDSLGYNIKEVNKEVIKIVGKDRSYNNTCLKIHSDNNKLSKVINISLLKDCIYNRVENDSDIDNMINNLILSFGSFDKVKDNLMIKIPTGVISNKEYYNNSDEFFDILSSIECYIKRRKELVEAAIGNNEAFVSYFNYLCSKDSLLDRKVSKDRDRLIKFLNNEDYSSEDSSNISEDSRCTEDDITEQSDYSEDFSNLSGDTVDKDTYSEEDFINFEKDILL